MKRDRLRMRTTVRSDARPRQSRVSHRRRGKRRQVVRENRGQFPRSHLRSQRIERFVQHQIDFSRRDLVAR
jgi:hypothetical protein